MKTFKAICAAMLLALSLSIPAYADTTPGDGHTPGSPSPITSGTGAPTTAPVDTELTGGATAAVGDISFSAFADIMWALASMF